MRTSESEPESVGGEGRNPSELTKVQIEQRRRVKAANPKKKKTKVSRETEDDEPSGEEKGATGTAIRRQSEPQIDAACRCFLRGSFAMPVYVRRQRLHGRVYRTKPTWRQAPVKEGVRAAAAAAAEVAEDERGSGNKRNRKS